MNRSLKKMRKEYGALPLLEDKISKNPFIQLEAWLKAAVKAGEVEPNAMCLSTSKNRNCTSRIVLLRGLKKSGLTFYTNYESEKGIQLKSNNKASLVFYWGTLTRQVRIEGTVKKVSASESDKYFAKRPRATQIAALLSRQSSTVRDRATLERKHAALLVKYKGQPIPRPKNWGGYQLTPNKFEFWQGREHRLHDRIVFNKVGSSWKIRRLYP